MHGSIVKTQCQYCKCTKDLGVDLNALYKKQIFITVKQTSFRVKITEM